VTSNDPFVFAEAFLEQERKHFLATAFGILRNREDAEDCVQDASLNIWCHWGQLRDRKVLRHWATSVVWNQALTILRRRHASTRPPGRQFEDGIVPSYLEPTVPSHEGMVIARMLLVRATGKLSGAQRQRFAEWVAGDRAGAVKAFSSRARARIRILIG
jgi:DNA-directed RNA polymerase specialized sigma24 family protein